MYILAWNIHLRTISGFEMLSKHCSNKSSCTLSNTSSKYKYQIILNITIMLLWITLIYIVLKYDQITIILCADIYSYLYFCTLCNWHSTNRLCNIIKKHSLIIFILNQTRVGNIVHGLIADVI